ncbi:OmpA family protein [Vibrio sp.]|uniref:OmpA family protein n=1 Tax=Vibrio sp. TaxID=678 RepID=UPI003D0E0692
MKKLAVVISASLMVASTPSMAQFYLGGKLGKSWLDNACFSGQPCTDDDLAGGVMAGYDFSRYLAMEAGYDYLGEYDTGLAGLSGSDNKVTAFTLAPKFNIPINETLALYSKLGGAYAEYGNKKDWSYLAALGLELNSQKNIAVRVEYQRLTDINNDIVRAAGNSVTLGLVYKFGGADEPAPAPAPVAEPVVAEQPPVEVQPQPMVMTKTYEATTLGAGTFAVNSTELKDPSTAQLDEVVYFLEEHPQAKVEVVGHTDSTGAAAYNQVLSEKRAQSVADAIKARGVDESRIIVRGEGETQPIADNATRKGREMNRRIEIIIQEFEYQVEQ